MSLMVRLVGTWLGWGTFLRRYTFLAHRLGSAEVKPCEGCNHSDDVRMLKVCHDLHFLQTAVLVHFIRELLFLQRDRLDRVDVAISTTPNLAHDSEGAPPEQFDHFKVISRQIRAVLNSNATTTICDCVAPSTERLAQVRAYLLAT